MTTEIDEQLARDGICVLPAPIASDHLKVLQAAFTSRLAQRRWNTTDGYQQNEKWRRLVEDLFVVHPAFMQVALCDPVLDCLDSYFGGANYQITEARGWETIRTQKQFHNWHNDAWYEPSLDHVPRQVKLGVYLTDVETGFFSYVQGSHLEKHRPGHWNDRQVAELQRQVIDVKGPAGTMFLFDTCGIHRQSAPILTPRHALMFNYHLPGTPIQKEDQAYDRYHAVRIDAQGLASLNQRQMNILTNGHRSQTGTQPPLPITTVRKRFALLHGLSDVLLSTRLQGQALFDTLMRPILGVQRRLTKRR